MKKEKEQTFMQKYEGLYQSYKQWVVSFHKKSIGIILNLASTLIIYGILIFIFLGIYAAAGFEVTIIILLIGVINFSIKQQLRSK